MKKTSETQRVEWLQHALQQEHGSETALVLVLEEPHLRGVHHLRERLQDVQHADGQQHTVRHQALPSAAAGGVRLRAGVRDVLPGLQQAVDAQRRGDQQLKASEKSFI